MPAQPKRETAHNGHGGKREGAGRKPDWFKAEALRLLEDRKVLYFVADVASGEPVEAVIGSDRVKIAAPVKDRLKAAEMLKEWGIGKEVQPVDLGKSRLIFLLPDGSEV